MITSLIESLKLIIEEDKIYHDQEFDDYQVILLLLMTEKLMHNLKKENFKSQFLQIYEINSILSYLTFVKKRSILDQFRYFIGHFESSYIHGEKERLYTNIKNWKMLEDYWRNVAMKDICT